jgi:hypothetical protein
MQNKSEKTGAKYKYDNRCQVSYPDAMYLLARKWATRKGISIQDLQRKAMEFYLNHLTHDEIVFTKDADTGKRATNSNDVKRTNSYLR